jgi:hypothetical protein
VPTVVDDRVLAPAVRELTAIVELLTGQRGDGSLAVPTLIKQVEDLQRRVKALEP